MTRTATITNRERALGVLRYQSVDRVPIVHFGFWNETLDKWAEQGHLSRKQARAWRDGNPVDAEISAKLGFDFNWSTLFATNFHLDPPFRRRIVRKLADGSRHVVNGDGVIVMEKPGLQSIPAEIQHRLTGRAAWEKDYKKRYQWNEERITKAQVLAGDKMVPYDQGGMELLKNGERENPYGLFVGSLYGLIRNVMGMEGSCLMWMMDPDLMEEIVNTQAELCYRNAQYVLERGAKLDYALFWEDICCKSGPLVQPPIFAEKVGPHYRRITALLKEYGIDIVSVDCDGWIDHLIPVWVENGVNTMFPIEVGTWDAAIAPWREKYGRELRGVGGMNKVVFARDKAAIDAEVERLAALVKLGGYLPCPDHRIPPDAKWELVVYYCQALREALGR